MSGLGLGLGLGIGSSGFRLKMAEQDLSFLNIDVYYDSSSLDKLIYFVNEVKLKNQKNQTQSYSLRKVKEVFQKSFTCHGVKIIIPFRTLLLRMFDSSYGFCQLHTQFLKFCFISYLPRQALPILQFPGLFKYMSKSSMSQFHVLACDIYCQIENYPKAFEFISKANKIQSQDIMKRLNIMKRFIVLSIAQGMGINNDTNVQCNQLCREIQTDSYYLMKMSSLEKNRVAKMVGLYFNLKKWRELQPEQIILMEEDGLYETFVSSKWKSLGAYIAGEVREENYRIKAESIKDAKLSDLSVIKGVNRDQQIYRYDCQEKIMYFNHVKCDQQQLNELITKAFNMQRQISNCKIEKSHMERGFGGMGMGMMGMGGMGMMGIMGGMGSHGRTQKRGGMGSAFDNEMDDD